MPPAAGSRSPRRPEPARRRRSCGGTAPDADGSRLSSARSNAARISSIRKLNSGRSRSVRSGGSPSGKCRRTRPSYAPDSTIARAYRSRVVGDQESALAAVERLVRLGAECAGEPEGAELAAVELRTERRDGVLEHRHTDLFGEIEKPGQVGGETAHVDDHDRLDLRASTVAEDRRCPDGGSRPLRREMAVHPASTIALGVATNVNPGQAIKEPGGIPAAIIASASAVVPLDVASA